MFSEPSERCAAVPIRVPSAPQHYAYQPPAAGSSITTSGQEGYQQTYQPSYFPGCDPRASQSGAVGPPGAPTFSPSVGRRQPLQISPHQHASPTYSSMAAPARSSSPSRAFQSLALTSPTRPPSQSKLEVLNAPPEGRTEAKQWTPDVYARSFVPAVLTAINFSPAYVIHSKSVPSIDYPKYVRQFSGEKFLRPLIPVALPPHPAALSSSSGPSDPLSPGSYLKELSDLLVEERHAQAREADSYNLYRVPVELHDQMQNLYTLHIPGLREGTPRLALGDYLCLRQLRLDPATSLPQGMAIWLLPGGGHDHGLPAPGFTGMQHNACVWGIDKAAETVRLRMDGCAHLDMLFNVVFFAQPRDVEVSYRAVVDVSEQLTLNKDGQAPEQSIENGKPKVRENMSNEVSKSGMGDSSSKSGPLSNGNNNSNSVSRSSKWIQRMLFPEPRDAVTQSTLPQGTFQQQWFDSNLNYEQMKAIDSIQRQNYGSIPFLISGPPGTGKTKSLVEAALQIFSGSLGNENHILICAPSDPAADTLASRLKVVMSSPADLLRLNHPSRTFAEVPASLLPFCYTEDDMFFLPDFGRLMSYKFIVTTCRDASMLAEARVTNRDLYRLESGVTSLVHPTVGPTRPKLHWTALLIDEAAQGLEPDVAIPLTVVAPPEDDAVDEQDVPVVMAGDQYQLGPRTSSKSAALGTSLFERLFGRPVYRDHPTARKWTVSAKLKDPPVRPVTWAMLPMPRPAFANLVRNYRSHAAIIAMPSALFYHDTLIPEAIETDLLKAWTGWKGRGWPVLFGCNHGVDDRELESGGWYNTVEAKKACDYAQSLVASGLIEEGDVCIMSPFRAQVNLLRRMIRARPYGLYGVNIGPMEAFQGLESRCVIVCTTRTRERYLEEDRLRGLGMIGEPKRFNVAVTRAKQGLIVIGNPELLDQDPSWRAFMGFCWRNGLWQDESGAQQGLPNVEKSTEGASQPANRWRPKSDERDAPVSSRLEKSLVLKETEQREGGLGRTRRATDEEAMWISGVEAEATFRQQWPERHPKG